MRMELTSVDSNRIFVPPPAPPRILRLWSANVTGSSFSVCWSSHSQPHHVYHLVLHRGPEVLRVWETHESMVAVLGLDPGVLYSVTVTPRGCGCEGSPVEIRVRTGRTTRSQLRTFRDTEDSLSMFTLDG